MGDGGGGSHDLGRRELVGSVASPGIAIGPAWVVVRRRIDAVRRSIELGEIEAEIDRFDAAMQATQVKLEEIERRLQDGAHSQILAAQRLMLHDPDLRQRVRELIQREQVNAEWALSRATDELRDALGRADATYFSEHRGDIAYLADRVLTALAGAEDEERLEPPPGAVVIAHDLSPADTAELARSGAVGIVTDTGASTSSGAIMARSLEIPAVTAEPVTVYVRSGDLVVVDAVDGNVIVRPTQDEIEGWLGMRARYRVFEDRIRREHGLPAIARDGTHIVLRADVALSEEIASAAFHGTEGVGLCRTDRLYLDREAQPTEEEHYRYAKAVLHKMSPYPVVFRTFDLGSDRPPKLFAPGGPEPNPALGLRSLRLALRERETFLCQLRGLLRAAVHGPLRIMLPFVSGVAELELARRAVEEARDQLESARMAYAQDVPLGIAIEMPSAAVVADHLAQRVDFMSIGTDELVSYTLAIDRDNEAVAHLYRPLDPSVLRMIEQVTRAGARAGIPVSVGGEMAAEPRYTWVLVGLGVRELSMHPAAIPVIKNLIRTSEIAEMEALAAQALQSDDVTQTEELVLRAMLDRFPEHLQHGSAQRLGIERAPVRSRPEP